MTLSFSFFSSSIYKFLVVIWKTDVRHFFPHTSDAISQEYNHYNATLCCLYMTPSSDWFCCDSLSHFFSYFFVKKEKYKSDFSHSFWNFTRYSLV